MAAGAGTFPKPDSERVGAKRQQFEWTNLPESGNPNPPPPMPDGYFSETSQAKWEELWHSPQSLMWQGFYGIVEKYIFLYNDFIVADTKAPLAAPMTGCEDRLGLSPKAMMQMRWRIVPDVLADPKFTDGEEVAKLAIVQPINDKPEKVKLDFDA